MAMMLCVVVSGCYALISCSEWLCSVLLLLCSEVVAHIYDILICRYSLVVIGSDIHDIHLKCFLYHDLCNICMLF